MDLQDEPAEDEGPTAEKLEEYGATDEEIEFLFGAKRRVELNAMTSRQFLDWLEGKLEEHGAGKVVPPLEMLESKARAAIARASCRAASPRSRMPQGAKPPRRNCPPISRARRRVLDESRAGMGRGGCASCRRGGRPMIADPACHMSAVAEILLGQPNAAFSSDAEWRYGTHGSLTINVPNGTFDDHEHRAGGGVLDLIGRELNCGRAEATQWLREHVDGVETEPSTKRPNGVDVHTKPKLGRVVATYDYVSEHGELCSRSYATTPRISGSAGRTRQLAMGGHGRSAASSWCRTTCPPCWARS